MPLRAATCGNADRRERLAAHMAAAGRLVAALEIAGADGDWLPALRPAEAVAADARELGCRAMGDAAAAFAAAVRRKTSSHALRNRAQMIVVEYEALRLEMKNIF